MTPLHYEIAGPVGAPILLMGGSLGTTLAMWEGQLPLAERLRLVRYDHRGHGASPIPPGPYEIAEMGRDVLELMDGLGLDTASYCGVSLGGMVGMWLGANAPERIDRLVLLCTSAHMPPASAWQERVATVRRAGTVAAIADGVVERWLTPGYAAEHPAVRAELRDMLAASDPEGYAGCCGAIERLDLREELSRITAPTLVISGSEDLATPVEHQRVLVDRIQDARHEIVPAAHLAAVEQSGRVNDLILEHLG